MVTFTQVEDGVRGLQTVSYCRSFVTYFAFSADQWLQLDLGPATLINGIVTRGRGDKKNWVTSYSLSYSNDTKIWFYYKDANHLEAKVDIIEVI